MSCLKDNFKSMILRVPKVLTKSTFTLLKSLQIMEMESLASQLGKKQDGNHERMFTRYIQIKRSYSNNCAFVRISCLCCDDQHFPVTLLSNTSLQHFSTTLHSHTSSQHCFTTLLRNIPPQHFFTTLPCNTSPHHFPTTRLYTISPLLHNTPPHLLHNTPSQHFSTALLHNTSLQHFPTTLLDNTPSQHFSTTLLHNISSTTSPQLSFTTLLYHTSPQHFSTTLLHHTPTISWRPSDVALKRVASAKACAEKIKHTAEM